MPAVNKNQCRIAKDSDWAVYILAHMGEQVLKNVSKAEEEKPYNQKDFRKLLGLEIGKLGCILIKFVVNENLCNPINM